jgi:hypothetical protein
VIKVTEKGIESGALNELTEEDTDFIGDMFQEFADYEKHVERRPDDD